MTDDTIVAVYDTIASAEAAVASLKAAGTPASSIDIHSSAGTTSGTGTLSADTNREPGFWASLFGGEPEHDTAVYDRSLEGGSTVVSVKASGGQMDKVMEILESHHPVDIDERASGYGMTQTTTRQPLAAPAMSGTTGTAAVASTDNAMQLSEEKIAIGKRVVNLGGTRIRRYVVETPVEENVNLHSEKVTLERRPVTDGRPVDGSFTEKTIEMTESAEEAIVSKTARVYEEVGLRKEATDRTETVRDTVRKEEVEIEKVPGAAGMTRDTVDPRSPKI